MRKAPTKAQRDWRKQVAGRIRTAMDAAGYRTAYSLSKVEGMPNNPSVIQLWLDGATAPDAENTAKLALVLGCSTDYLLLGER